MRKSTGNPYFFTPKSAFFSCRGCCLHRQDWKGQVLCAPAARLATGHWTQWFLKNEGKVITRYTEEIIETMGLKTWAFLYGVMRHSILHMVFTEEIIENTEGLWYEDGTNGYKHMNFAFFPGFRWYVHSPEIPTRCPWAMACSISSPLSCPTPQT
jgi:hypothetical protein